MGVGAIIGLVCAGIALLLVVWFFSMYNTLVKLKNNVEEAYSSMDVSLKKRYDLIPNFVETVKGYAKHEKDTLTEVIKARNLASNSTNPNERIENENKFSETLKSLLIVVEKYPELKADKNFNDLQNQLAGLESEIAYSRKFYNANVKILNEKIEMIPTNLVAKFMKLEKRKMYEVSKAEERENVKVKF